MTNVKIVECNMEGMTIDGILVTELIAAYKSRIIEDPDGHAIELFVNK